MFLQNEQNISNTGKKKIFYKIVTPGNSYL